MEWIIIIGIFIFAMIRFLPTKGIENITTEEARLKVRDKDIQFIDVRTPGEFNRKHSKQFKNIPLYELSQRFQELDKNKEVFIICQSGMRSAKAARILKRKGFTRITNIKGGMGAWGN